MNIHGIPTPEAVKMTGNIVENWNIFKDNKENYSIPTGLNEREERIKVAILLPIIGRDTFLIYQHLDISQEERKDTKDTNAIIETLTKYLVPAVNAIYER
ncbi:hypothetical protein AVEN_231490-1 [Araneus ventricosus]|uniref:Uncharacterized protein n=1 Tax=Araneus ventricosus TaxID=182803 RepID=A0A4Y2QK13_ARAVE|nr:hypothetical protein AVEN_231490-1 [Araneus ventricosus]